MKTKPFSFVGRKSELSSLHDCLKRKRASLVVIKGRRRIGKSRLVEEFAREKKFYFFSGLPPENNVTAQLQRNEFSRQTGEQLGLRGLTAGDWGDLFALLAKSTSKGRVIILLDEISWMGSKDPTFLGKLKIAWDLYFSKNPQLMLILCGSISSWIDKNIISSTGFLGRIALKITLKELSLKESNLLLNQIGFKTSAMEKFMLLSLTGEIPWYLELINAKLSASENIKRLCFMADGILTDEFKNIFNDLFGQRGDVYRKIVECLAQAPTEYSDICNCLGYPSGGPLSEYLDDLVTSGYIRRDYTWSFKTGKEAKLSQFRLQDNYLRFYLKYIGSNINKIKKGQFQDIAISSFPGWNSLLGLQFENMVLNNRNLVWKKIGIKLEEIVADNPFFQRKTVNQKGCQIDYMIQTKYNCLYVCEIKCSKNQIGTNIIRDVQEKIARIKKPKGFSCRPVLIHAGEVSSDVLDSDFFAEIIDFGVLLDT